MKGLVIGTVVTAVAFYLLVQVLPNMFAYSGGYLGLIVIAVIFGVVNGLIGPIVKTLAMPISFMTMGLVGFLINGVLLLATAYISDLAGFDLKVGDFPPGITADTLIAAVVGAVVLSLITTVIRFAVPD